MRRDPATLEWVYEPEHVLMEQIFGPIPRDEIDDYCETAPYHDEIEDGHTLRWAVREALNGLSPREARVVIDRFGIRSRDATIPSFKEMGVEMGVAGSRVQQIVSKSLRKFRKLRNPQGSSPLRLFIAHRKTQEINAANGRFDLYVALAACKIRSNIAKKIAISTRRENIAKALSAVLDGNLALANAIAVTNCFYAPKLDSCWVCGDVTLPGLQRCMAHLARLREETKLVCYGCGVRFLRPTSLIINQAKLRGRTPLFFHDLPCARGHGKLMNSERRPRGKAKVTLTTTDGAKSVSRGF